MYLLDNNTLFSLPLPRLSFCLAEFQEHLIFRAYNSETIQAQSASLAHSIFVMQGKLYSNRANAISVSFSYLYNTSL